MTLDFVALAAGRSARYGAVKQLEPVGPHGELLLDYTVYAAQRAGCDAVVLIVRPDLEERFANRIAQSFGSALPVRFVCQDPAPRPGRMKPWGTGEALLAAERAVRGPFIVANADDCYGPSALAALARHLRSRTTPSEFALVGYRLRDTVTREDTGVSRAVCEVDREGSLVDLVEVLDIASDRRGRFRGRETNGSERTFDGSETVSMNLWGFTPSVFPLLRGAFGPFRDAPGSAADREFRLSAELGAMVRRGDARVRVLPVHEEAFGLTHPNDLARVGNRIAGLVESRRYPSTLWDAVRNRAGSC